MLILASASPRRHEILTVAGIPHIVRPTAIPEILRPGEAALDFVRRLAQEKASAAECGPDDVVLGADTIVLVDDDVFGKPADDRDAARMLRQLSGRAHTVCTGICLRSPHRTISDVAETRVFFVPLSDNEIQEYTRSGEPRGKAGGYAIQGLASRFVSRIEGCFYNVVGLPISLVCHHLKTL
ncbi:MAG: Maf family protein [Acidobacteriota bacterium]|nr:Maf family protein [Acidobacteriota bacterium]